MGKVGAWVWVALVVGCSQEEMPCRDPGEGWIELPQSRVAAISAVRVQGGCDAVKPRFACSAGECFVDEHGEERRVIRVVGRSPGRCTVTVVFADGCGEQALAYEFGGPTNDCCADACLRPSEASYAIDACATTQ